MIINKTLNLNRFLKYNLTIYKTFSKALKFTVSYHSINLNIHKNWINLIKISTNTK